MAFCLLELSYIQIHSL